MSEKNNKTINGQKIFCLACMGLMAVASVVLVIMLFTSGLLNKGIVWAITGGLALLNGLHSWARERCTWARPCAASSPFC